jgi:hypothetical protein
MLVYLSLRGRDPSEEFKQRLRDLAPWAKKHSQCRVSARGGMTDHEPVARGRIVEVISLS